MNAIELFVRHQAELDALEYYNYFSARNPEAALRFLQGVDQTVRGLQLQPFKGRRRNFAGVALKDVRSWRVDGFENYLIFYRLKANRLEIMRIRHGVMLFPRVLRRKS